MAAQNSRNTFDNEWKKVESFESDALPKSAIQEVDKILKQALVDKNTPQVIKSLLIKNKYKSQIDNDDNIVIFNELQDLVTKTNSEIEKALLHSLLAELYIDYFNSKSWEIFQRTNLVGEIPEDIKEWTVNIFADKVLANLDASVNKADVLKKSTTKEYKDIIILGKDSEAYYPSMFDFLMTRAISLSQNMPKNPMETSSSRNDIGYNVKDLAVTADEFVKLKNIKNNQTLIYYQQYFKYLLSENKTPTIILAELNKANYLSSLSYSFQANDFKKELIRKYEGHETVVAIIENIIQRLISSSYNSEDGKEKTTEAYNWCQKAISQYPNYQHIGNVKRYQAIIEAPQLDLSGDAVFYPGKDMKISIEHKNLLSLNESPSLNLYKVNKRDTILINQYKANYASATTYLAEKKDLDLGKLGLGNYILKVENLPQIENEQYYRRNREFNFVVSRLAAFSRNSAKGRYDVYVVDRMTGKPLKDADIAIYENNSYKENSTNIIAKAKTDAMGLASMKNVPDLNGKNYLNAYYIITYGDDVYLQQNIRQEYFAPNRESNKSNDETHISIFTDRSIYRPGQTVYFKAIAINNEKKPMMNKMLTVELKNTSYETISKKELKTNEFASIAGEFVLPQTGLLGQYPIEVTTQNGKETIYINVEEYKRPTFEITFDKIEKTYSFGQEVIVKGYAKNFSGINLQNANVQYTIKGNKFSFWRYGGEETFSQTGEISTKEDGSFEITFTPLAGDTGPSFPFWDKSNIQQFTITADVTDVNNETQSGNISMLIGDVSMIVRMEMPQKIEKSQNLNINIKAMNLSYVDIETSGEYTISSLNENDSIVTQLSKGTFRTGEQPELSRILRNMASGKYRVQLIAKDSNGKDVNTENDILIYSYRDKKPPIKTNAWLIEKNVEFSPTKKAEILFGVSDENVYVLYQLHNKDKVFENKWIKLSNENQMFTIPYKAEYGEELYLTLTYIKGEEYYTHNINLTKEKEKVNTSLYLKMEVFRDKLRPGQEETWTVSVKDEKEKPMLAEVLASMYDASLDKLGSYHMQWMLNLPYQTTFGNDYWYYNSDLSKYLNSVSLSHLFTQWKIAGLNTQYFTFDKLNKFGFNFYGYRATVRMATGGAAIGALTKSEEADNAILELPEEGVAISVADAEYETASPKQSLKFTPPVLESDEDAGVLTGGETPTPQIRSNFNETAFFYPQLKTNENGETLISFTVPESNTQWKFRVFAHDKESKYGHLEQLVVTRKELMVTPNMPRFVRQGDKTSISTKISNLSENAITGKVQIEFFDPLTDKSINLNIENKEQDFSLIQDASTSASWTFDIPDGLDLIGCRIIAANETFSDGEQHVLSVLPNRILVTESMPFDAVKAGENTFVYEKLNNNKSQSLQNYRLTFEYTANPAWYAVQALPTLSNPTSNDVISWFASYYVNTLGASIVKQYPQVSNVIKAWQKQGGDKQTLMSKLQKDQELKSVLLSETPWVLEAKDETEQMQRLSLLFDLNNTNQLTEQATRKLADLQDRNGGWSWYKGMYPSRSMTQYILYGYAKLVHVGQIQYGEQIKRMQISALNFIDKEITKDLVELKKNNKKWQDIQTISTNQLEYLYVRTFYRDIPITQEAREAERFYTSIVSRNWQSLELYERSLLVTVLFRNGEKELANKIAKSIREYSVTNDKFGMYWPNNKGGKNSSKITIARHTFLMDALQETGATTEEMDMMKQWLVKQKQVQAWETTPATISAIGALLSSGSNWFDTENPITSITVGNENLMTEKPEMATGYIKKTWEGDEIKNNMAEVRIEKQNTEPSYGALYWQYYEDLDKITQNKTNLNIDKKMFKTEKTNTGHENLTPITKDTPLQVGDKVTIRLTVRIDSNMDFVHLKDMRAPCFEPIETISGIKWQNNNAIYYQETRDASTNMYFDHLAKGTYVFEYQVYVNRIGTYSNGITSIQSIYAPEFISHTKGENVTVR